MSPSKWVVPLKGNRLKQGLRLHNLNQVWSPKNKEIGFAEMMTLHGNK